MLASPNSTLLLQLKTVTLQHDDITQEYTLLSARKTPDSTLLRLAEVTDRNHAETLRGYLLLVKKEQLPVVKEGELYLYQLEGKRVITLQQEEIGVVEGFLENNTQTPIMVVRGPKGEYLLPVIPDVVLAVNEEENKVTIDLLDGFEPSSEG